MKASSKFAAARSWWKTSLPLPACRSGQKCRFLLRRRHGIPLKKTAAQRAPQTGTAYPDCEDAWQQRKKKHEAVG